jgi:hypothetical protein
MLLLLLPLLMCPLHVSHVGSCLLLLCMQVRVLCEWNVATAVVACYTCWELS